MASRQEEDLRCPFCHDVFKDPVIVSCSHTFCRDCLNTWWEDRAEHDCPVCKKVLTHEPISNLALKNLCESFPQKREAELEEALEPLKKKLKVSEQGVPDLNVEPNTAKAKPDLCEDDPELMKISSFTPEMQTESARVSYRFRCPGPGVFQCTETGLVFGMAQGAELRYRMVQWDESRLKPTGQLAAGPLFDIQCSEDAVRQLHFPHCETKDALCVDDLLSVAHFTEGGMSVLKPLHITDTHVVVKVTHLSLFGIIFDRVKRLLSFPVCGQVRLFLRSPGIGPRTLHVFLLPRNVPVPEVVAQQENAEYIPIPGDCVLRTGWSCSLHCDLDGLELQLRRASFCLSFGSIFLPTFTFSLTANPDVVTLKVQDQDGTEVWKRDVYVRASTSGQQ